MGVHVEPRTVWWSTDWTLTVDGIIGRTQDCVVGVLDEPRNVGGSTGCIQDCVVSTD